MFSSMFVADTTGVLCGNQSLSVWDDTTSDFGTCFATLTLILPSHFFLAVTSAFGIGDSSRSGIYRSRTKTQKCAVYLRAAVTLLFAAASVITFFYLPIATIITEQWGYAAILEVCIVVLSWVLNFVFVATQLKGGDRSHRGTKSTLLSYALCLAADSLKCRTYIRQYDSGSLFIDAITVLVLHCLYLITLLPPANDSNDHTYEVFLDDSSSSFLEDSLGVAKLSAYWPSRLFMCWVNPLIEKGRRARLNCPGDVFGLPRDMTTGVVCRNFQTAKQQQAMQQTEKVDLFKILYRTFGRQFFAIGLLKLIADCAGFASPLLLNLIVSFMEQKEEGMGIGYLYAAGLAATSIVVALCNTHFNLLMSELGLKVRASVVSAVFRQTVGVSTAEMAKFNVGEVINFMSTDVDRVVNFSPSLHAAWSLPFQFSVTLFLLYQQVGVSSLAGVVLTVLMVPLNKVIADNIGRLSTKMMLAKDQRVKVVSEILHGIRVIKFFAWETYFSGRLGRHRKEELKHLRGRKYLDAVCVYLWATTPVLISVLTFGLYVLLGNVLTAAKVFTSVALFAMLTGPLNAFPWVLNGLVEARVSIGRVSRYLSLPQLPPSVVQEEEDEEVAVRIDHGLFSSSAAAAEQNYRLSDVSLTLRKGEFLGVVGRVGSGKSSLLQALLGELKKEGGSLYVNSSNEKEGVAYVQQEPWLQQGTIRDNILFGKPYAEAFYNRVIDACALRPDLQQLAKGDRTEVGEHGAMLSGGQKARVALARAVYQDKQVYLIDDVFSAVDAPVGIHIYKRCLLELLAGKTRVLCTHHPRFLAAADKAILMDNGKIVGEGAPADVLTRMDFGNGDRERTPERDDLVDVVVAEDYDESDPLESERQERGQVKLSVYKTYWMAVGRFLSPAIFISLAIMQGTKNFTDVWLAQWVSADDPSTNHTQVDVTYYLTVYGSVAAANSLASLARAFLFAYGGVCAAKTVHDRLTASILLAKSSFFDSTPAGRILNRFSSDLYTVDDGLPFILNVFLANVFGLFGPLIVCTYSVPWIILLLIPLTFMYLDIQKRYRPASRDLKRMASVSLSPIYAHFSETLSGLQTIRAMKSVPRFVGENEERLEANQRAQYAGVAASQWLEMRLQLIGCAVVAGIAVVAMIEHHFSRIDPGFVGLAISYALGITGRLSGLVSSFTETEKQLVAVERCIEYIEQVPPEKVDKTLKRNWSPTSGKVSFKNVSLRYRDNLPLALDGLSFETGASEKIGVVGRTGAGKSSIFQCLFRMVVVSGGQVTFDGEDVAGIDLGELRRCLSIIPQEPFLFSGTVRENLDPSGLRLDPELWEGLRKSRLAEVVQQLGGLEAEVAERGRSFSVGQRQLFCLARAVLSDAKVVCVDEATANVDLETDRLVQEVLRESLSDRTVITIAHRVDTILGSDRVVVMSGGRAVEVGEPRKLLEDPNSEFSKHVAAN